MAKTVLITGGSRGIGRATAIQAGGLGWNVGVNYVGNAEAAAGTVRARRPGLSAPSKPLAGRPSRSQAMYRWRPM
jgi:NAD(P)-dependent dehydrogenase (short-subunit alcohol dehydrogenase family)